MEMGLFDFLFGRYRDRQLGIKRRSLLEGSLPEEEKGSREFREVETLDKAIRIIQKNPYMKYAYDLELLQAIEKFQEQLAVNQQIILDAVTIKDPKRGEIGLSDWLSAGALLRPKAEGAAPPPLAPKISIAQPAAAKKEIGQLRDKVAELEAELAKQREKAIAKIDEELHAVGEKAEIAKPKPIARGKKIKKKEGIIDKALDELRGVPSILRPTELFKRKARFDSFVYKNFYFEYPLWPADLHVSEDVILSVSSGPFGVELSAKDLYPLTFRNYVTKIVGLLKVQLKATITKKKATASSAYLEFEFSQRGVAWLYKSRMVECDDRFYTVVVKGPKDHFDKISDIAKKVLNSVKCLQ